MKKLSLEEHQVLAEINQLKNSQKPIILFGSLAMAMIVIKVLEEFNILPECIVDNKFSRQCKKLGKWIIYNPAIINEKYLNCNIIICSFNEANITDIMNQLKDFKCNKIFRPENFYNYHQTSIVRRKINSFNFGKTLEIIKKNDESNLILNTVSVSLTEKCSLNCQNCAAFVPYFAKPKNYDKNTIITSIINLSKSVDAINVLTMFGGEPFLHPDLIEICEAASELDNVKRINLITNGTILPSETSIKKLSELVSTIYISNYGSLSTKKKEIHKLCIDNNIILELDEDDALWSDLGSFDIKNRTKDEKTRLFKSCWRARNNHLLLDGNLYICSYSAFTNKLKIISQEKIDYVDLISEGKKEFEIREEINFLFKQRKFIDACGYCELVLNIPTEAAIQQ